MLNTLNDNKIRKALLEFYKIEEESDESSVVISYILGEVNDINEADGQEILNRFIKVLKSSKSKLITATVMVSLMSNLAFSQAVEKAPDNLKSQISRLMKTDGNDALANIKTSKESKFNINFTNNFESGTYEIEPNVVYDKLNGLKEFLKDNGNSFKIKVRASESQVPNQDGIKSGDLAKRRASILSSLIKNYLEGNDINGLSVESSTEIGDAIWDGGDKNDSKYIDDQFVIIELHPKGMTACEMKFNQDGKVASVEDDYISFNQDLIGKGRINLTPGSIPDRMQVISDDGILSDTGYFADGKHSYKQWDVIPLYIAKLTEIMVNSPDSPAVSGLERDVKTFSSFDNLVKFMLKDKTHDYSTDSRGEISEGLKLLKKLWDMGQKSFLFYSKSGGESKFDIDNGKVGKLLVYSPVGNTGFSIKGDCN